MPEETDFWRELDAHIDAKIANAHPQTFAAPSTLHGAVAIDRFGHVVQGAAGSQFFIYAEVTGGLTITNGSTTRINFNHVIEDASSLITTGASWAFTPAVTAYYAFSLWFEWSPSGGSITTGGFVVDKYHSSVNDVTLWSWDVPTTIAASVKQTVFFRIPIFCTNGQSINFRIANNTGRSMVFTGNPSIFIEKVFE